MFVILREKEVMSCNCVKSSSQKTTTCPKCNKYKTSKKGVVTCPACKNVFVVK